MLVLLELYRAQGTQSVRQTTTQPSHQPCTPASHTSKVGQHAHING